MSITTYSEFENYLVKNGMNSNEINLNKASKQLKSEIDEINSIKQDNLVSGTNIKTINGSSILGAGDIIISGGSSIAVSDDSTTNNSFYPILTTINNGTLSESTVSSSKLYFNPSSGTLNSIEFNAFSDSRLKENIKTIDNALHKTTSLRGVKYNFINDVNKSQKIGLIAQEVKEIIPEVINDDDEFLSINYNAIIGLLVESIKELNNEITLLKEKIF